MVYLKVTLLVITILCIYSIACPQESEEVFNLKIKSSVFVGLKKRMQFVYEEDSTEIVSEKFKEKDKIKNLNDSFKFECDFLIEVLELNEEEKSSKVQITFRKASYIKDGEEKTMHFALNEPYILVLRAHLVTCYFRNNEIKTSFVLNYLKLMNIDFFSREKSIVSNIKLGEVKESNEDFLNIGQIKPPEQIEKEKATVHFKKISYNEQFKEKCGNVLFESSYLITNTGSNNINITKIKIENEFLIGLVSSSNYLYKEIFLTTNEFQGVKPDEFNSKEIKFESSKKVTKTIKVLEILK